MHRLFQHMMLLFIFLDIAAAALPHHRQTLTRCPIIFDGRTPLNATLSDFDDPSRSPFNTKYVKGENLTWSSIIQWPPSYPPSRFDPPVSFKPLEITIDDQALFRSYQGLQLGFRRAGLQFKNDVNDAGADEADNGTVTFHWSVQQDLAKPLNLTHEYMNVWHERADYGGNQWTFTTGVILPVDGGDGKDTLEARESFKVQDKKNNIIFSVPMQWRGWQNFAIQLDYEKNTIQVFYSISNDVLEAVTKVLPNDNSGGGQMQLGIAKKPTETKTVVWDGYQEPLERKEGQSYGGIFVENSSDGCISL